MGWVRDSRVGQRLTVAFGLVAALLVLVVAVGLWGGAQQRDSEHRLAKDQESLQAVLQLKFRAADLNAWQTTYAFDAFRDVRAGVDDRKGSRKAFLDEAHAFERELAALESSSVSDLDKEDTADVKQEFAQFMEQDDQVVQLFRQRTQAAARQATDLVTGEEHAAFESMVVTLDKLVAGAVADGEQTVEEADDVSSRSRTLLISVGAIRRCYRAARRARARGPHHEVAHPPAEAYGRPAPRCGRRRPQRPAGRQRRRRGRPDG
jgi:hypothetical protein